MNIQLPNSVVSIGQYAFSNCGALTDVVLANSLVSLGTGAFSKCNLLANISIPNSIESLGEGIFTDCVALNYKEYDNALYLGNSAIPHLILMKAKTKDVTTCNVNSQTKIVDRRAFESCKLLTNVTLSSNFTTIAKSVLSYTNNTIWQLNIHKTVTSLKSSIPYRCNVC